MQCRLQNTNKENRHKTHKLRTITIQPIVQSTNDTGKYVFGAREQMKDNMENKENGLFFSFSCTGAGTGSEGGGAGEGGEGTTASDESDVSNLYVRRRDGAVLEQPRNKEMCENQRGR